LDPWFSDFFSLASRYDSLFFLSSGKFSFIFFGIDRVLEDSFPRSIFSASGFPIWGPLRNARVLLNKTDAFLGQPPLTVAPSLSIIDRFLIAASSFFGRPFPLGVLMTDVPLN